MWIPFYPHYRLRQNGLEANEMRLNNIAHDHFAAIYALLV